MKVKDIVIGIEQESCIKCGKCARVCPAGIMVQESRGAEIVLEHQDSCIVCGHCVDVCPTGSVIHSAFPPDKQHAIDYSMMPAPEQVMLLIKSRRSNRALTPAAVPGEMLEKIVEAARYAPTASNSQQVSFTVITDAEKLKQISSLTIGIFDSIAKRLMNPALKWALKPFLKDVYAMIPALQRLKQEHEAGNDPVLRRATALLVIHTPRSYDFGSEDSNLAYQNASLMAQSLGISQIYMGFVLRAIKEGGADKFARISGIDGKVNAIMALGMPAFKYPKYTDR